MIAGAGEGEKSVSSAVDVVEVLARSFLVGEAGAKQEKMPHIFGRRKPPRHPGDRGVLQAGTAAPLRCNDRQRFPCEYPMAKYGHRRSDFF